MSRILDCLAVDGVALRLTSGNDLVDKPQGFAYYFLPHSIDFSYEA